MKNALYKPLEVTENHACDKLVNVPALLLNCDVMCFVKMKVCKFGFTDCDLMSLINIKT